jgi:hypothetical protein
MANSSSNSSPDKLERAVPPLFNSDAASYLR